MGTRPLPVHPAGEEDQAARIKPTPRYTHPGRLVRPVKEIQCGWFTEAGLIVLAGFPAPNLIPLPRNVAGALPLNSGFL
jgi:hypothetical protein